MAAYIVIRTKVQDPDAHAASAQAFYDSPGHQQALASTGGAFTREVVIVEGD